MREDDNEVQSLLSPVVGEGVVQSSSGDAVGRSVQDEDDDRVPLSQWLKRSRSSAPEGGTDLLIPMAREKTLSAPSAGVGPPRGGRKRLKTDWALRPGAAGAR